MCTFFYFMHSLCPLSVICVLLNWVRLDFTTLVWLQEIHWLQPVTGSGRLVFRQKSWVSFCFVFHTDLDTSAWIPKKETTRRWRYTDGQIKGSALNAKAKAVIIISHSCVSIAIVSSSHAAVCVAAFEIAPERTIKHEVFMCRRAS